MNLKETLKDFFVTRKQAYQNVFNPESEMVKKVMKDLIPFCRFDRTAFHADARAHAILEGRREVMLRIKDHVNMTMDEFLLKYGKGQIE